MHEFSIAQGIVDYAISEGKRSGGGELREVRVDVGDLTLIDRRVLSEALRMLLAGSGLAKCRVRVKGARTSFVCRKCSNRWSMEEAQRQLDMVPKNLRVREPDSREVPLHFLPGLYSSFIVCTACGSSDVEASGGDDVRIRRLVFE